MSLPAVDGTVGCNQLSVLIVLILVEEAFDENLMSRGEALFALL